MSDGGGKAEQARVREEQFAELFVELGNASEAYRQVYSSTAKHVGSCAFQILDRPRVRELVAEYRKQQAELHHITVGSLLDELEEARMAALCQVNPSASAAVAATMGKARIVGMDKQIQEHVGKDGQPLNMIVNFVKPGAAKVPEDENPLC